MKVPAPWAISAIGKRTDPNMKKTIDGLVLREVVSGDSDKVVTMLTASEGKLIMTAKGARSAKSKIAAVCRPFTYGNFE